MFFRHQENNSRTVIYKSRGKKSEPCKCPSLMPRGNCWVKAQEGESNWTLQSPSVGATELRVQEAQSIQKSKDRVLRKKELPRELQSSRKKAVPLSEFLSAHMCKEITELGKEPQETIGWNKSWSSHEADSCLWSE